MLFFSSKEARFVCGQDVVFLTSFSEAANALTIWTDVFRARSLPAPNQIYFLIWPYGISFIGNVSLFIPVKICPGFASQKGQGGGPRDIKIPVVSFQPL